MIKSHSVLWKMTDKLEQLLHIRPPWLVHLEPFETASDDW